VLSGWGGGERGLVKAGKKRITAFRGCPGGWGGLLSQTPHSPPITKKKGGIDKEGGEKNGSAPSCNQWLTESLGKAPSSSGGKKLYLSLLGEGGEGSVKGKGWPRLLVVFRGPGETTGSGCSGEWLIHCPCGLEKKEERVSFGWAGGKKVDHRSQAGTLEIKKRVICVGRKAFLPPVG